MATNDPIIPFYLMEKSKEFRPGTAMIHDIAVKGTSIKAITNKQG